MYVPKSVLVGLMFVGAVMLGWALNGYLDDATEPSAADPVVSTLERGDATAAPTPPAATIVNVTLDASALGGPSMGGATPGTPTVSVRTTAAPATAADGGATGEAEETRGVSRPGRDATAPRAHATGGVSMRARSRGDAAVTPAPSSVARGPAVAVTDNGRTTQAQVSGATVSAIGDHIIIAYQDSIVFVGDDGQLTGNTGDAASSGTLAMGVSGSDLASGDSSSSPTSATARSVSAVGPAGTVGTTSGAVDLSTAPGRAVSIAGFEDHSVHVAGSDSLLTYDDSNVFIARDGQINANTGDTDSSGLNVLDARRSVVRSGASTDGGADTEEPEELEDEEEDAGAPDLSVTAQAPAATAGTARPLAGATGTSPASGSVTDEGDATASGDEALVIGADGYDDLSANMAGRGNAVTYDDSNVVIGGTGAVHAQVGDADTGGAVVMGVEDSLIEAGASG